MLSPLWLTLTLLACSPSSSFGRPSDHKHQTSQPVLKTLGQEIGSPSELAWQAWLLVESKGGISSALDSSNILRRITPKSIFIAPELISCPSGYSTDGRGSCRPDPITIDEDAQKQFILKRLNALYGKFGSNKKKPQPPQGPLQINIPISLPAKNPQPEPIPVLITQQPVLVGNNKSEEAVEVVVYKVENDTKKDESSEPFLLGNTNTSAPKKVAEIIVEANDTFTGVVDYKIPLRQNSTNLEQQSDKKLNDDSSEDSSPTVVLLLSPTKLPSTTEKPKEMFTEETKMTETTTLPTTIDEIKFETIQTVAPLEFETDVDTTIRTTERPLNTKSRDDYEHRDQQMTTTTSAPSTMDDETAYTDEDETQTPEQESEEQEEGQEEEEYEEEFAEDELLKPGEAGSMMSAKNQELIRSKIHRTSTLPVVSTTTMLQQDTTTIPPTIQDIYDAKESTIKTEVTGFTTQTTDVPSTIVNTVPEEITTITTTTTTVTPRPQRVKATIQINPYVTETRPQPTTIRMTENNPTEPPPTFFLQRQPQRKPPSFTVNDEPIFFKDGNRRDNNNLPPEFKDQLSRDHTYVRFPESPQQQKPQHPRGGFVRFPSDEVNSIHNQDSLKDLSPFQYSSSTKSSVQRWRQQKQKPMLLRFWARMPLVRDLTFYPTTSHGSHNEPIGGPTPPTSRRGSIFTNGG